MKASTAIVMVLLLTGLSATAAPPLEIGANKSEIYKQLGPPDGILELPSKTTLLYETAELTLVDGILASAKWKTDEEVAMETVHREKVKADWERYQESLEVERHQRGLAILERKKADAAFKAQPGREQARFWRDFIRDYPSVDATEQFDAAVVVAQAEATEGQEQAALYAKAQPQQTPFTTTTSLIDTVDVGGYAYNSGYFYPPYSPTVVAIAPSNTVVVGGGGYCPPVKSRPILNVGYNSNNFSIRYSSGGGTYGRPCIYPQQRPIVIVNQ